MAFSINVRFDRVGSDGLHPWIERGYGFRAEFVR